MIEKAKSFRFYSNVKAQSINFSPIHEVPSRVTIKSPNLILLTLFTSTSSLSFFLKTFYLHESRTFSLFHESHFSHM